MHASAARGQQAPAHCAPPAAASGADARARRVDRRAGGRARRAPELARAGALAAGTPVQQRQVRARAQPPPAPRRAAPRDHPPLRGWSDAGRSGPVQAARGEAATQEATRAVLGQALDGMQASGADWEAQARPGSCDPAPARARPLDPGSPAGSACRRAVCPGRERRRRRRPGRAAGLTDSMLSDSGARRSRPPALPPGPLLQPARPPRRAGRSVGRGGRAGAGVQPPGGAGVCGAAARLLRLPVPGALSWGVFGTRAAERARAGGAPAGRPGCGRGARPGAAAAGVRRGDDDGVRAAHARRRAGGARRGGGGCGPPRRPCTPRAGPCPQAGRARRRAGHGGRRGRAAGRHRLGAHQRRGARQERLLAALDQPARRVVVRQGAPVAPLGAAARCA